MNALSSFPRVAVPGVSQESRDLVAELVGRAKAADATLHANRVGMARAMQRLGYRPYLGHVFRKPKPTKHVRHMARIARVSRKGAGA